MKGGKEEEPVEKSGREEFTKTVGKTREENDREGEREGENRLLKITNEPENTTPDAEHKYSNKGFAANVEMAVYSCKLS